MVACCGARDWPSRSDARRAGLHRTRADSPVSPRREPRVRPLAFDRFGWSIIGRICEYNEDQEAERQRERVFLAVGTLPQPDFTVVDLQSPTPRRPAPQQSLAFAIPRPSAFPEDNIADIPTAEPISAPAPSVFPEDAQIPGFGGWEFEQRQWRMEDGGTGGTNFKQVEWQLSRMRALLHPERSDPVVSCRVQNSKKRMMRSSDSARLGSFP